jgi:aerobic-type carbon monoxide dehydrogenase small subunit (CoxS/CutS family)
MAPPLAFQLNGEPRTIAAPPYLSLLEVLRDGFGLTGTKEGCGLGECGACTVHLDGRPVLACLTPAFQVAGRQVTTIEGLSRDGLTPLQEALVRHGALQCGFCTPGLVMAAAAILAEVRAPTEAEVRRRLAGNVCRCTGYTKIVEAIIDAARSRP